jgi:hypothetical protein
MYAHVHCRQIPEKNQESKMNIHPAPRVPKQEIIKDPDDNFAFAIASLVLSLVSIFLIFVPFIGLLGIGGWILGIILGISALKSRGKVMAIAGIVLSIIGLITAIVFLVQSFLSPNGGF